MPMSIMELRQASQLAERLSNVTRDIQILKRAWGGPILTVGLTPDKADYNRTEIGGNLLYQPTITQYLDLLQQEKKSLEDELHGYGVTVSK